MPFQIHVFAATLANIFAPMIKVLFSCRVNDNVSSMIFNSDRRPEINCGKKLVKTKEVKVLHECKQTLTFSFRLFFPFLPWKS